MGSRERDNLRQWLSARLDWLISAGQRRWISVLRLIGAALITLTVFFYFYWACFFWGLTGVWSRRIGALLAVSWLAIVGLTYRLGPAPSLWRFRWLIGCVGVGCWILLSGWGLWRSTESLMPIAYPVIALVAASLIVPCSAWMFFLPWKWRTRLCVGVFLLGLNAPFWFIFEVDYAGSGRISYDWRVWGSSSTDRRVVPAHEIVQARDQTEAAPPDFPQFLGPQRTAVLPDVQIVQDWTVTPPERLWQRPVGAGWGSFAIVGRRALTQEQRGDDECVVCYHLLTGEELWVHANAGRFESANGPTAKASIENPADNALSFWNRLSTA